MISYMFSNIEDFSQLSAAVNSDMPSSHTFSSIEERIIHMAHPNSSVAEMEISSTSEVLQQPIHIINAEFGNVVNYKDDSFPLAQPVSVLYSPHGDSAGHYDCVLESSASTSSAPQPSTSSAPQASTSSAPQASTSSAPQPSTSASSSISLNEPLTPVRRTSASEVFVISPREILPFPQQTDITQRVSKQRGRTVILTSSPYKKTLVEANMNRKKPCSKPCSSTISHKTTLIESKNSQTKRKITCRGTKRKITCRGKGKGKKTKTSNNEDEDDTQCLYCADLYSESTESWVACVGCLKWAHYSCAGLDEKDKVPYDFECEMCA